MTRFSIPALTLACVLLSNCTQALLMPFSEGESPPPPEERVLITSESPQFEAYLDGTLFFLEIPEWDVVGVPAFVEAGLLSANFSVPSDFLIEGVPVPASLHLDDPSSCPAMPVQELVGFIRGWIMEERIAEFVLEVPPEPWVCE